MRSSSKRVVCFAAALVLAACGGGGGGTTDGGRDGATGSESGAMSEGGTTGETGVEDSGGAMEAAVEDAAVTDSAPEAAVSPDAMESPDAMGSPDAMESPDAAMAGETGPDVLDASSGGGDAASEGGSGGGDDAAVMPDALPACAMGETRCSERCVTLASDPSNCGACGTTCPMGQSCVMGACACPMGSMTCGGACVSVQTDVDNCGMCGRRCPMGQACTAGTCGCPTGTVACGDRCVSAMSDEMNCGMCGRACGTGQSCELGMCACPTGQTACGMGAAATCVNTQTDGANCGACGAACPMGQTCVMGACACPMGQTRCGTGAASTCVNAQTDNENCGACGTTCAGGSSCVLGTCQCPMGETRCGTGAAAACVNTQSDTANCGACGTACPSGQVCNSGRCETMCSDPNTRCGAGAAMTCSNLATDDQNCGTCGTRCGSVPNSTGALCLSGTCRAVCESGFANCDANFMNGCEANTNTDVNNCGGCGTTCPTTATGASAVTCAGGTCRPTCNADTGTSRLRDCNADVSDGCEANVLSDANNCGACGTVCAGGVPCVGGLCMPRSCNALHTAAPALPSGLYDIDPDGPGGNAPVRVYCDMTTDGGGWTLVAYATTDRNSYSACLTGGLRNFYSLASGGGTYNGAMRMGSAALNAVPLSRISTEIAFGRSSTVGFSGDISGMTAASKFNLPSPSTTNFGNASRFAPASTNPGSCVPVTLTVLRGPAVANRTRYTFSNAVSVGWGDAYPVGYGAYPVQNCSAISEGVGPMFANEFSGSYNYSYCGSTGPNFQQGTYVHHGWWDADSQRQLGTASIWLR